jgi:hypothetical protein
MNPGLESMKEVRRVTGDYISAFLDKRGYDMHLKDEVIREILTPLADGYVVLDIALPANSPVELDDSTKVAYAERIQQKISLVDLAAPEDLILDEFDAAGLALIAAIEAIESVKN